MANDYAKRFPSDTPLRVLSAAEITAIADALYLKLDQTTPQTVANGLPLFQEGIKIGYSNWELKPIDVNTLGLYVNGNLAQSWTVAVTALAPRRASLWFLMPYVSS